MSKEKEESAEWNGDPIESPYLRHIVEFAICRKIDSKARYEALMEIATDISDTDQLKEALFYLEHTNWNVSQAKLLLELDAIDRAGPPRDSNGNVISNHAANPVLDTRIAEPGANFDIKLCKLKMTIDGTRRTFVYPESESVNKNSQKDVDNLNRWRHRTIRQYVGIPEAGRSYGQNFHQLEIDYLLNRYSAQAIDSKGHCKYVDITEDYNAVFEGVFLPGRPRALTKRSQESITSILTRKAVNPQEPARQWPKDYNGIMRHNAAQERIKMEWQERLAFNEREDENEKDDDDCDELQDEDRDDDDDDDEQDSEYQDEPGNEEESDE